MTGPASHRPSRRDPGSRRDGPPPLQCAERWRREMTGDGVRPSWPAGAPSPTTTGSRHELTGQTAVTRRQKRSGGSPSTASAAAGMTVESLLSPERSALAMRRAGRWWTSPQPVPGAAAGIRLPPRGRAGHQGTRSDDLLPVDHDLLHEALLGCCLRQNLRDFLRALILAGDDTNHVVIHDALQLSEAGTIPQPNTASASRPATPGSAASAGFTYTSVGVTGSRGRALLHRQSSERLIRCPALAAFCVHSARGPGRDGFDDVGPDPESHAGHRGADRARLPASAAAATSTSKPLDSTPCQEIPSVSMPRASPPAAQHGPAGLGLTERHMCGAEGTAQPDSRTRFEQRLTHHDGSP